MKEVSIYYLHNGNNVPFYIGKSKIPNTRIKSHKKTYGSNTNLEILDKVFENEWRFWEKWYIQLFNSWGFDLLNQNAGGGGCITHTKYSKNQIGSKNKKRIWLEEWSNKISQMTKGKSKNMPSDYGERISRAKKGIPNPKLREVRTGKPHPKKSWKIDQFDVDSNYIKTHLSAKEAGEFLNKNPQSIRDAASGIQKTAYGYIWKYKK